MRACLCAPWVRELGVGEVDSKASEHRLLGVSHRFKPSVGLHAWDVGSLGHPDCSFSSASPIATKTHWIPQNIRSSNASAMNEDDQVDMPITR